MIKNSGSMKFAKLLIMLSVFAVGKLAYADSVGQAQVTKYFAPETIELLLNRINTATPGIQQGDTLTYIIESVPVDDGGSQGVNGYITDYIPKGLEVVGASFVHKIPAPLLPGGFDYVDVPMGSAGLMQQGAGKRNTVFPAPFSLGGLPEGSQDTGIFYSTDPRTDRLAVGIDVTACTAAGFAAPLLVFNQWDIDQYNAFGNGGGCPLLVAVEPALTAGGDGTHPLVTLGAQLKGLSSPVAGPQTYYQNDYNPGLITLPTCIPPVGTLATALPYACAGPWKRISYPGSAMGGQGPIIPYLATGAATAAVSTAVPTSAGVYLTSAGGNPNLPWAATVPATRVNAVRWAFGQRVVGTIERVKIKLKVQDFAAFSAPPPLGAGFINHSSVFGGDITAPAAGKDLTYKYLGPTQSISDARLMLIKQVVAVSSAPVTVPAALPLVAPIVWVPSDGAAVIPGHLVKYRISYLNATSTPLNGFNLTDTIDILANANSGTVNVAYVPGSATSGVPFLATPLEAVGGGSVSWLPGPLQANLAPGGGGSVELVVHVLPGAATGDTTTNIANATTVTPALNIFSYAPSSITTSPPPQLSNSKTVTPSSAIPGQNVKYSVVVSSTGGPLNTLVAGNQGPPGVYPPGGNIVIGDILDPGLTIAPNTLTTPITVSLRDRTTGLVYPYPAATAVPIAAVLPIVPPAVVGVPVSYWSITGYPLTYPAPVPLVTASNYLTNVDFLIDFYATVNLATAPGTYFNAVESYGVDALNGDDLNWLSSGLAPVTVTAPGSAIFPSLTFTKTATDINGPPLAPVLNPGDDIRYDLTVTNAIAPSPLASTLNVVDSIPGGTQFVVGSALAAGAVISYSNNGGFSYLYTPIGLAGAVDPAVTHVQFSYPSLATGATVSPAFTVRTLLALQDGTLISNQASLNALAGAIPFSLLSDDNALLAPNPNPTVSAISAPANFTTSTKLVAGNTGGGTNVQPGDILTYSIVVTNTGYAASNVQVTDIVDTAKLTFGALGVLPPNWSVSGPDVSGVITWSLANMPAGATATLTFTATVKPLPNGDVVNNSASIVSNQSPVFVVNAPTLTVPAPRVSGVVYNDLNGDGVKGVGEPLVANVTVALRVPGAIIDTVTTTTDALGAYLLTAPAAGDWYAQVTDQLGVLNGYSPTTANPIPVTLVNGVTLINQDFGYQLTSPPATILGRIFNDADFNGLQNGAEIGHNLVTVELRAPSGVVIASTTTDILGDYIFTNIAAGNYELVITDASGVLFNRYLTTGLATPLTLNNVLSNSTTTVNFGYALGSQIGDVIFDDANANGIQDIGETGVPGITVTLSSGGSVVNTAVTDNNGLYLFTGVPPANYTLDVVVPLGFTPTPIQTLLTTVSGVDDLTQDFGITALPNLAVTKVVASPSAALNSASEYTITVVNSGGAAANFSVIDILPTTAPPVATLPALPFTPSTGNFQYLATNSILLNGLPFNNPTLPLVQYVSQPQWANFTMPASSTLTITFTAFTGSVEGVQYNGVRLRYNNSIGGVLPDTVLDYPDLAIVTISNAGTLTKNATAVNGIPTVLGVEPLVNIGDTVTYTVTLANSAAEVAQALTSISETMPVGFSYVLGSSVLVAPVNPLIVGDPLVAGQVLTWTMPPATPPSTLGLDPLSQVTLSFDLLVNPAAIAGSQTDSVVASVIVATSANLPVVLTDPPIILSTGNTAPVTVLKPLLSMSKATSTPLITKDIYGQYSPASYTISVVNSGGADATGVVLTDVLPAGFTFGTGSVAINGIIQASINPIGGFVIPANNGVADGNLIFTYNANISPANISGVYTNTVSLASTNAGTITGISSNVELTTNILSKVADTPSANQGGVVSYTISVANDGLNPISVTDILPAGFTYKLGSTLINGLAAADPVGTLQSPQWILPATIGVKTLAFSVDVGSAVIPGIYYNSLQASDVSGAAYPNPGPTAPVTVLEPQPLLTVLKSANTPLAAPGATILYTVVVSNTGDGQALTVVVKDAMSPYTKLALDPFANGSIYQFTDGVNTSGLAGTGTVSYFDGNSWGYVPVDDGSGHDPAIQAFKISLTGTMNANPAANPSFKVEYQVQVK